MSTPRLPVPGQDDNTWGQILNSFLEAEHNADGSLKIRTDGTVAPLSGGKVPVTNLGAGTGSTSNFLRGDGVWSVPAGSSGATISTPGLIQLAGDLGGTATAPLVTKVNGIDVTGTPSSGQVMTATSPTAASWAASPVSSATDPFDSAIELVTSGGNVLKPTNVTDSGFDVILCAGQSNMSGRGVGYDLVHYDPVDPRIYIFGTAGTYANVISQSVEPLMNYAADIVAAVSSVPGMSPAGPFARWYQGIIPSNRKVLLVNAAYGGTGFEGNDSHGGSLSWKIGTSPTSNNLYERAIASCQAALAAAPNSRLVGILWHQGEQDAGNGTSSTTYRTDLEALIDGFRTRFSLPNLPFVLGRMTPEALALGSTYTNIDTIHQATPGRKAYTGFAWGPGAGMTDPTNGSLHYSAAGQRVFGKSYFDAFIAAKTNTPAGTNTPAAPSVPAQVTGLTVGTIASTTVGLSWTLLAGASNYLVEYRAGAGSWNTFGTALGATATVSGLTVNTSYTFRVTGRNGGGSGTASATAAATTATAGTTLPITDTYTDTAGTLLTSHTPDSGGTIAFQTSTPSASTIITAAGRIRNNSVSASANIYSAVPATADYSVEADFYFASVLVSSSTWINGRTNAASSSTQTCYTVRYLVSAGAWQLLKVIAGAGTVLATFTPGTAVSAGETHHAKLTMSGTSIGWAIDSVTQTSVTDSAITSTGLASINFTSTGVVPTETTGIHIDNFSVLAG